MLPEPADRNTSGPDQDGRPIVLQVTAAEWLIFCTQIKEDELRNSVWLGFTKKNFTRRCFGRDSKQNLLNRLWYLHATLYYLGIIWMYKNKLAKCKVDSPQV